MYPLRPLLCAAAFVFALAAPLFDGILQPRASWVITDGSRTLVFPTACANPESILAEAGMTPGPGDRCTVKTDSGIREIRIHRAQRVTVNYRGIPITVTTHGETVGALLTRLGLLPEEEDRLSVSADTQTFDGMAITVSRITRQEETYSSAIPHTVRYCFDPSLATGRERVLIPGADGELRCTVRVTYTDGQETEREVLSSHVTRQPVDALIARGAAPIPDLPRTDGRPVITDSTITLPTGEVLTYDGVITSLATAYCDKGLTATGTQARVGAIAVDPRVIPYGTRMFIISADGEYVYGIATAEDCGSLDHIVGRRIDLHFDTYAECRAFGARKCYVYFLS